MINIEKWMETFIIGLNRTFENRLWFVGLQGSYGRGEATESSDIDVVVILDEFNAADIKAYNDMLDTLPHRELICGFISGKKEILGWEPSELFQFYYDTKPVKGSLDDLLTVIDSDAVDKAIRTGACNIYHGCVHNMLHEKSEEILKGLYKSACFVILAVCYKQRGVYISSAAELITKASEADAVIIKTASALKKGAGVNFDEMSVTLFDWAKKLITEQA